MVVVLGALFLVLAWLQPLHISPWLSWHSELLSFLAVLLLSWYGIVNVAISQRPKVLAVPLPAVYAVAFLGVVVLQWVGGLTHYLGDSIVLAGYLAVSVMSVQLGYASGDDKKALQTLAFALLVGAFASAIVAFVQFFDVWEGIGWINRMQRLRRPGANLAQPNQLATLLLMGGVSVLLLFESAKLGAASSATIAATLLVALVMTESRAGFIGFFALGLWWVVKRKSVGFRLSPWGALGTALAFVVLSFTWPMLFSSIGSGDDAAVVRVSVGSRWIVWPQLIDALLLRPWFGWGLGQVSTALNAVAHLYDLSEPFSYAHNIVLDLALGLGLPLATLGLWFAISWLRGRMRGEQSLASWYCIAVIIPVVVHSLFEFPFAYGYFLFPVMFAFGLLERTRAAAIAFRVGTLPTAIVLLAITTLFSWSIFEYVAVEEDFRFVRSESLRLGEPRADEERPNIVLLSQLGAMLSAGRVVPKPGMSAVELDALRKAALRFPWAGIQRRYALSLALNSQPKEAARQLQVIRALHKRAAYLEIKKEWTGLARKRYPELRDTLANLEAQRP